MSTCGTVSPEVVELLERFALKKQNVKHRLSDIVDDLFGDFITEISRIASTVSAVNSNTTNSINQCSRCCSTTASSSSSSSSLSSTSSSLLSTIINPVCKSSNVESTTNGIVKGQTAITSSSGNSTINSNTHPQQQQQPRHPSPSSSPFLDSGFLNVQSRAKELIKDELDYDKKLRQFVNSAKQSRKTRRRRSNSSIDCEPNITLTPIIKHENNNSVIIDYSTKPSNILPNSQSTDSYISGGEYSQNDFECKEYEVDSNNLDEETKIEQKTNDEKEQNLGELNCKRECETNGTSISIDNGVSFLNDVDDEEATNESLSLAQIDGQVENGNSTPSGSSSSSSSSKQTKQEPNSTTNIDGNDSFGCATEKSLEELNTLCSELPYSKMDGKYICKFQDCSQELKSRHNLLLHQRAHLGIRPYRCKWPECSYNSNQSSAVIRHIRTKHFQLPLTMREQAMKNIEDDRDPKEFLEVVATNETSSQSGGIGTELCVENNSLMEKNETPAKLEQTNNSRTLRQSTSSTMSGSSSVDVPKVSNRSKNSILTPSHHTTRNGKQSSRLPMEESDSEDEYDDDDADIDSNVNKIQNSLSKAYLPPYIRRAQQIVPPLKSSLSVKGVNNNGVAIYNRFAVEYARKRRLETKNFPSSRSMQTKYSKNSNDFSRQQQNGQLQRKSLKSKLISEHFSPLISKSNHYQFCPVPECPGIFRTQCELDRHLNDVHNTGPVGHNGGSSSSSSDSNDQYSNLFACQWANCRFTSSQQASAINHVRTFHLNNNNVKKSRRSPSSSTMSTNPSDYINLMNIFGK